LGVKRFFLKKNPFISIQFSVLKTNQTLSLSCQTWPTCRAGPTCRCQPTWSNPTRWPWPARPVAPPSHALILFLALALATASPRRRRARFRRAPPESAAEMGTSRYIRRRRSGLSARSCRLPPGCSCLLRLQSSRSRPWRPRA
jgi:hypothetical protein